MTKSIFPYLIAAAALVGCNSSDDTPGNSVPVEACYDFATLASSSEKNSTFTLQRSDDSPLVTYSANASLSKVEALAPDKRLIIMYTCDGHEPYTSGPITLYGYRLLDNTEQNIVRTDEAGLELWKKGALDMTTIARTGKYVNMQLQLACQTAARPKKLDLAVDSTKVDEAYPTLYLLYEPDADGLNTFTGYASFDLSEVWSRSTCEGVKIVYQTFKGTKTATFRKDGNAEIKPVN